MKRKKHKEANFISAVLYLHRQEKNVIPFLEKICRMLEANFENFEIICVDDDAGEQIYRQIVEFQKNRDVTISVIHMGYCQGIEAGMNAGVDLSIGDYVFEFDSGFAEYEEPLMMEAYEKCMAGYDIVSVRMPKAGGRLSSKIFYKVFNRYSHTQHPLATELFCIVSRRAVNRVSAYSSVIPYRKAVYAASGMNLAVIECRPRQTGNRMRNRNRQSERGRVNTATVAIVLFTDLAYRVSLFFSAMMAVVMFGFGIYTVAAYFMSERLVAGWSPLMGLLSLGFLSLFLLMTFMFKYLETIVKLLFKKQKYSVQTIENMNCYEGKKGGCVNDK